MTVMGRYCLVELVVWKTVLKVGIYEVAVKLVTMLFAEIGRY